MFCRLPAGEHCDNEPFKSDALSLLQLLQGALLCCFAIFSVWSCSDLFLMCLVFQVWGASGSVQSSGQAEESPEALSTTYWSEPQSDGSNKQSFITTAATRCHCCHHGWLTARELSITTWTATPPLCGEMVWTKCAVGWFFFPLFQHRRHNLKNWTHDGGDL